MENIVIGRKQELELLSRYLNSPKSEMIVLYGRRRVGKTFIVQQACENKFDFYVTGLYHRSKAHQLANFANVLAVHSGQERALPRTWQEAFAQLRDYLSTCQGKTLKVFIDELPWMSTPKSDLVAALEAFWNGWGSAKGNLKLILCGSSTSWIVKEIFHNKGGLFNRDSCRIALRPFRLAETEEFCLSRNLGFSRWDVAMCHMILGGIPYYLDKLQPGLSLPQNIDNLLFKKRGMLTEEFKFLYSSLFNSPEIYVMVVELLAKHPHGFNLSQIASAIGKKIGGNLSTVLHNLESSDIVTTVTKMGSKGRELSYVLSDFFTIFYLHFVKDNATGDETFWLARHNSPEIYTWRGNAFELLCLLHVQQIREALGVSGVAIEIMLLQTSDAQIDLVIERGDNQVNLCEMKFVGEEYEIKKDYVQNLLNKIEVYKKAASKKRRTINLTFISSYGVRHNAHSSIVQKSLTMDALFQ